MIEITAEQAQETLQRWVDILRLGHWDIELKLMEEGQYALEFDKISNANVYISPRKLMASIAVNLASKDSFDYCVVHELVHIMLEDLYLSVAGENDSGCKDCQNDGLETKLEVATHTVARALILAYETVPIAEVEDARGD